MAKRQTHEAPEQKIKELEKELAELRRSEEALRCDRDMLRSLMDGLSRAGIGVDIIGIDYRIHFQNKLLEERFGGLAGQLCHEKYMGLDEPCKFCSMMKAVKNDTVESVEYTGADGRYYEVLSTPLPCPDGTVDKAIEVVRDITERKRTGEALLESEDRYRTLFHDLADPVFIFKVGEPNTILDCNRAMVEKYGYSRRDILKMTPGDLHPTDELERVAKNIKSEVISPQEYTHIGKDGARCFVEVHSRKTRYKNENARLSIIRDITDRKRAAEERERLMSVIEQVAETIVITDAEGAIQYVNPAFERVTGYTREEAVGRNPRFLKSGERDGAFYRKMWRALKRGEVWRGRFINKKKDGSIFTEEAMLSPVRDASGAIVNYVAVKRDITEDLRLQNEKAKIEERYRQAQKVESIGRLAGGVAHDLNNLLTPIIGYGELLMDGFSPNDARRESMNEILRAGLRARDLVRQLLAFSRKQTLKYKPVDMNMAIENLQKLLLRTIREDIDIEFVASPDIRPVMADIGQIEQVIINLVVNAADAMPEGGHLLIETAPAELDGTYADKHHAAKTGAFVMLAVSDTGCGMDEEIREHIFEPFFSTKGNRGTGLGLATVYGIVKQHGGGIWVYSEPGKGASFKVYLPVSEEARDENETGGTTPARPRGSGAILLVEDDAQVRRLAHAILEQEGYSVLAVRNGAEALAVMASRDVSVDLLLTDVVMPEMNGRELYNRAAAGRPGLKVLFMSGYPDNVIAHHGVLDDNVQFIQKPFSIRVLTTRIREVLTRD